MDEFETYEDVIDAYNANDMGYSTLTDYIKGQNIKIKEISMEPLADLQKSLFENKADGGMIGIEVLFKERKQDGGRVPAVSGGFLKLLAEGAAKGKQGIMELIETGKGKFDDFVETQSNKKMFRSADDIPPTSISQATGPMTIEMMEAVDPSIIQKVKRTQKLGLYEETPEILKAANLLERFTKKVKGKRVIDYERAEAILGVSLKGDETINDLFRIEFETRPVEKMAEGGRVGLFMGGDPLTGQALAIYNSMNVTGATDQEIADRLQALGLYTPSGSSTPETTQSNIIGAQLNQGGDGRVTELQETFTKDLSSNSRFNYLEPTAQANKYRFDRSVEPRDGLMGFFDKVGNKFKESKFFQPKIKGTLGTRLANQPKLPIPSFASFLSNYTNPFNMKSKSYNPLLESQLNFAETQDGIIGRDPNSGLLKYGPESVLSGKNVVSMFGTNDYEKMLQDYITKMNANKKISATTKAAKLAKAQKELEELQKKTEAARAAQYGKIDYGRGSDGQRSYSGDAIGAGNLGFGIGATTGGPVSNRTGRGRQDYSKGGLATMFIRRR